MNEKQRKILETYKMNFWIYAEILGILLILPGVVAFAIAFIDFTPYQIRLVLANCITMTVITFLISMYVNEKIIGSFTEYINLSLENKEASMEIYSDAQKRFTQIPWYHSIEIISRWMIGLISVLISVIFFSDSRTSQITNLIGIGFFGAILNSLWSFSVNEFLIARIARTGIFNKSVIDQRKNNSRLFNSMALQIGSSILLLSISILIVAFNLNSRTLTKAFENQMNNINEGNLQIMDNSIVPESKILPSLQLIQRL